MSFFSEYKNVKKLLQQKQQIVFYAENRHYYQYFEQLVTDLLQKNIPVCYITSDKEDPLFAAHPEGMEVIFVKWQLGFLFSRLRASVMIMTMPDLGNFLFKRSPFVDEYIYMFHAAVSTHQQYRLPAFFNYDTIFCTGHYQEREIRRAEELYGKKEKKIIHYGYPLFDAIQRKAAEFDQPRGAQQNILIAPSWFEGCIFDTCIEELAGRLSALSCQVMLRSHPEYEKRRPKEFRRLKKMIRGKSTVSIDTLPAVTDRLVSTDILITDRSGIAFEFALGKGNPVLFVDTALKQSNSEWQKLGIEPVENSLREKLGVSILPSQLDQLELKIKELEDRKNEFGAEMKKLKEVFFYNSPGSYAASVRYVMNSISKG